MNIREKISEIIERELNPIPNDKRDINHKFYYRDYRDNLIYAMAPQHFQEYSKADGGELNSSGRKPAKMASIASSSAMTFNLLGNQSLTVKEGQRFSPGQYSITYEKQLYTLKKGSKAANLDAFLKNEIEREAIFCEMKMLEWIGSPPALKASYLDPAYYFCGDAYDVFHRIALSLRRSEQANDKNAYPSLFRQYDAWQMFKHTLAIYNATSESTVEEINQKAPGSSMCGQFDKITLANIVFEMDLSLIADPELRQKYSIAQECERREADLFFKTMLCQEYGLLDLFRRNCRVNFEICYLPASVFAQSLIKTPAEWLTLRRYCC